MSPPMKQVSTLSSVERAKGWLQNAAICSSRMSLEKFESEQRLSRTKLLTMFSSEIEALQQQLEFAESQRNHFARTSKILFNLED